MTGVAETAADSIDDLASFLGGETEGSHEDEEEAEEGSGEESDEEQESDESEEQSEEEEQAPRKIKVPVKGEDGSESVEEIDETELVSGYMRQKAFTQKTMELSTKERQATEIVQQRVTEASQYALQQAQAARDAVIQLAGLKSADEMHRLAIEDQASWVQENARSQYVNGVIEQLNASIKADQERVAAIQKQQHDEQATAAWEVLTAKGIDHAKLTDIFSNVKKAYGVTSAQIGKLMEPGLALALKDALAYRDLQAKKPAIAQKVKEAERLPAAKKSLPPNERVNKSLGEKFSRGRAKVNDLAAFLQNNKF